MSKPQVRCPSCGTFHKPVAGMMAFCNIECLSKVEKLVDEVLEELESGDKTNGRRPGDSGIGIPKQAPKQWVESDMTSDDLDNSVRNQETNPMGGFIDNCPDCGGLRKSSNTHTCKASIESNEFPCGNCGEPIDANNNQWEGMCLACYVDNPNQEKATMTPDNPNQEKKMPFPEAIPFSLSHWLSTFNYLTVTQWVDDPDAEPSIQWEDHAAHHLAEIWFNRDVQGELDTIEKMSALKISGQPAGADRNSPLVDILRVTWQKNWIGGITAKVDKFPDAKPYWDWKEETMKTKKKQKKAKKASAKTSDGLTTWQLIKAWIVRQLKRAWVVVFQGGISITVAAWMTFFGGGTLIELLVKVLLEGLVWYLAIVYAPAWALWVLIGWTILFFLWNLAKEVAECIDYRSYQNAWAVASA